MPAPRASRSRAAAAARASNDPLKKAQPLSPTKPQDASATTPTPGARTAKAPAHKPAVADEHASLLTALRDEMASCAPHALLPASLLTRAQEVFECYALRQWATTGPLTTSLGPVAVEGVIADLGLVMSPNDVKDLVFSLRQSADVVLANARVAQRQLLQQQAAASAPVGGANMGPPLHASDAPPPAPRRRGSNTTPPPADTPDAGSPTNSNAATSRGDAATTMTTSAAALAAASDNVAVPFRLFLDLLMTTLGDCTYGDEMSLLWHHLDADGDDTLSHRDVAAALTQARNAHEFHCGVPQLTEQQLAELLRELDGDDDGRVSKQDFLDAVNTN